MSRSLDSFKPPVIITRTVSFPRPFVIQIHCRHLLSILPLWYPSRGSSQPSSFNQCKDRSDVSKSLVICLCCASGDFGCLGTVMAARLGREKSWKCIRPNFPHFLAFYFYAHACSKNSGRALRVTPVSPSRAYVPVPIRVRAITTKPYGIYLWNFTGACMTLRRCVMKKEDNSCLFGFWIICRWLSSI